MVATALTVAVGVLVALVLTTMDSSTLAPVDRDILRVCDEHFGVDGADKA